MERIFWYWGQIVGQIVMKVKYFWKNIIGCHGNREYPVHSISIIDLQKVVKIAIKINETMVFVMFSKMALNRLWLPWQQNEVGDPIFFTDFLFSSQGTVFQNLKNIQCKKVSHTHYLQIMTLQIYTLAIYNPILIIQNKTCIFLKQHHAVLNPQLFSLVSMTTTCLVTH